MRDGGHVHARFMPVVWRAGLYRMGASRVAWKGVGDRLCVCRPSWPGYQVAWDGFTPGVINGASDGRRVGLMLPGDSARVDRSCSAKRLFYTLNDVRDRIMW